MELFPLVPSARRFITRNTVFGNRCLQDCATLNQKPNLQPKFFSKAGFHFPLNSGNPVFKFTRLFVEMKPFFPPHSAEILNFNLQLIYVFI